MLKIVTQKELWKSYTNVGDIFELHENAFAEHVTTFVLMMVFMSLSYWLIYNLLERVLQPKWYIEMTLEKDEMSRKYCAQLITS